MKTDDGVLTGLKVIDCATYVARPAAATILSDFGADVVKVERPPDCDLWRTFSSVPGYPSSDFHYTWLLTSRTPPAYGADTREALIEVGYSAADINRLIQSGAAAAKEDRRGN